MAWRAITSGNIQGCFAPTELASLSVLAGNSTTELTNALTDCIRMFIGAMRASNYPVLSDDTVPDQLRVYIIDLTVITWIRKFPSLEETILTKARKDAGALADKAFNKICDRTFGAIESPFGTDTTTANWNSQPKVIGRMSPVPLPALQLQQTPTPIYANPNAPTDDVPSNSPGVPEPPLNFAAVAQNAKVLLTWNVALSATTYSLYKSTQAGQEVIYQTGLTGSNFTDNAVTNGTFYFYKLVSVNTAGTSAFTPEVAAQPVAPPITP